MIVLLGVAAMVGIALFAAANVNAMATVVDKALPDADYGAVARSNRAPPDDYLNLTVRKHDARGSAYSRVRPLTPGDVAWHRVTQAPDDVPLAINSK
jgi:hypothetical protein